MSKIEAMRAALSDTAIEALTLAGSENEGHEISGHVVTEPVMTEFRKAGVVGRRDGQTRIGALLAGKLIREYEAKAF
jgi:hypothetical protein